nr:hypothetical protein [Tanacetum cinerariifolium]
MKTAYALPRGMLPLVVIREPELGKYQPLPEVPGKDKAKVTEEQVSYDLLSLQKAKKKIPVEQYIFQRCTFTTTGSSGQNEPSYAERERSESETTEKVVHGDDKVGQGESEGQAGPEPGAQAEGQMGSDTGAQDETSEDHAGSNPDETSEGQAGPDPGNTGGEMQSIPSPMVYAGSDRTLSSLQHLSKDISFGDLFFNDKPSEADNEKTIAEIEVESMVYVMIQQDMSTLPPSMWTIPPMKSPIVDLTSRPESPKVEERDLLEADMKEILHQRMWETESYKSHKDHMQLFEALKKSMNRDHSEELTQGLAEARKKKKKSRESSKTSPGSPPHQPPPPPPPAGPSGASRAPGASGSSQVPPPPPPSSTTQESPSKGSAAPSLLKTAASAEYQAWTTTDVRLSPSISLTPADLEIDEDMGPDEQAQLSDDEDIGSAYIPKVNLRQDWWKPLEEEQPATPEPAWSIPSSDVPVPPNNWASALASSYSPPPEDSLLA